MMLHAPPSSTSSLDNTCWFQFPLQPFQTFHFSAQIDQSLSISALQFGFIVTSYSWIWPKDLQHLAALRSTVGMGENMLETHSSLMPLESQLCEQSLYKQRACRLHQNSTRCPSFQTANTLSKNRSCGA